MTNLRKVHERELFDLVGQRDISLTEIQPIMMSLGFVLEDDFAWLRRTDQVEQWQTETLVHCEFLAQGREVYPDESDFDSLRLSVLVSSLPLEQVVKALHVIFDIADKVRLGVSYASRAASRAEISVMVAEWSDDIFGETGDGCGSESAAILISMEYDKRRAS
jgi:hypothetical protein